MISVEVVYATRERQILVAIRLTDGATAADALRESAISFPVRQPGQQFGAIGIRGRVVSPETQLKNGDRVEIYRPLTRDPRLARRKRSAGMKPDSPNRRLGPAA